MEWATQWHGPEGKVHADKRTVEYTGRGNHSADAVSFVGAVSVGQELAARARRAALDRVRRAPCLTTPLDGAAAATAASSADGATHDGGAADALTAVATGTSGARKEQDSKKNKLRGNGNGKASAARKKRRVGASDKRGGKCNGDSDGDGDSDGVRELLQLPVYYFEVQVLATRHFQSDPGGPHGESGASPQRASGRGIHQSEDFSILDDSDGDGDDDEEENGDDDSEMKDDDDDGDDNESDEAAMDVDMLERAVDASAPWRGRARRLIHDHLRVAAQDIVASVSEGGMAASFTSSGSGSEIRHNGHGVDTAIGIDIGSNGDPPSERRSSQDHTSGSGGATSSRLVRSTSSTLSPPSPPQLSHQQLLLSFPLSSSTIHQIRMRLERQHQQAQSQRRRFSSSGSSESGSVSLTTAISSIQARQRRETVRRKRSTHRIAVGFMFSKHGGDYKRDICHDELGRQACGIALVGKTGAVLSNGQTFLQTDVRFGHGDTIGCGVILDTRTFFWTVNGRLVATIPVSDVHHLDDYEDHSVDDTRDTEWFSAWADQILPAVSLHEHGECVRATFGEMPRERFRFDLGSFKQQQLKHRQTTLSTYAVAKSQNGLVLDRNEEDIMHKLVEDYFVHFGYGNALAALHNLYHGNHSENTTQGARSVDLRHTVRQMLYALKTRDALQHLELVAKFVLPPDSTVLRHCHILCVVDVLYEGKDMRRKGTSAEAILTAQEILHDYLREPDKQGESLVEIREFMSVLLYPSVDAIPNDCAGRRFLIWQFREEVADAVNDALLSSNLEPCALETLVDDLSELQRECLTTGVSPFPADEENRHVSRFHSRHKREHEHKKRRSGTRQSEDDSEDDNDESHSSSSGESVDDEDDDDDE